MRGTFSGGYLLRAGELYKTQAEAENRLCRIRRDFPDMKSDNSRVSGNYIWYYEIVPYGNGWAVLSSYSTKITY